MKSTRRRHLLRTFTAAVLFLPLLTVAASPAAAEGDPARASALVSEMAGAAEGAESFYNALPVADQDLVRAALTPTTMVANRSVNGAAVAPYDADATSTPYANTIGSQPSQGGCISTGLELAWKNVFGQRLFDAALTSTFCDNGLQITSASEALSHNIYTFFWSYQGGNTVKTPTPAASVGTYGQANFAIKLPFITLASRSGLIYIGYTASSGALVYSAGGV